MTKGVPAKWWLLVTRLGSPVEVVRATATGRPPILEGTWRVLFFTSFTITYLRSMSNSTARGPATRSVEGADRGRWDNGRRGRQNQNQVGGAT